MAQSRNHYAMNEIRDEIRLCAKCGKCRAVCPTFLVTGDEAKVARGRISLIEALVQGVVPASSYTREILMSCYRCMRCVEACPSGVRVDQIIQYAKNLLAREMGLNWVARMVFRGVLPRRRLYDRLVRAACLIQRVFPGDTAQPVRHLPLFYKGKRHMPRIARRSALQRFPELVKGRGALKVSVFAGCVLNYVYPEIVASLLRVLEMHGVDIIFPKNQLCCGAPVLACGDLDAARTLARRNIASLEPGKVDAILFGCASCGFTMKHDYPLLIEGAERFADKVYDITEFIDAYLGYSNLAIEERVTYHDPCHLRWGRGIAAPPRKILRESSRFVEMEGAESCCGLGGSFSLTHYRVSCALGEAKVEAIRASGADIVATACPGCILQLQDQLARNKMDTRVMHVIQIYEMSYLKERLSSPPISPAITSLPRNKS